MTTNIWCHINKRGYTHEVALSNGCKSQVKKSNLKETFIGFVECLLVKRTHTQAIFWSCVYIIDLYILGH